MMIRTFIALELPEEVLQKILEIKNLIIPYNNQLKWEPLNKLHLTLKFLGNTKEEIIPDINTQIEKLLNKHDALYLSLSSFGMFLKDKIPRILWIGLKEDEKLSNLVSKIDALISNYGYEKEKRKFTPHITLLRIKESYEKYFHYFYKLTETKLPEINFVANKITFFKSILLRNGSVYEPLKSFYIKN